MSFRAVASERAAEGGGLPGIGVLIRGRGRKWWGGTVWALTSRPIAGRAPALGGGIPGCEAAASGPMCFFVY